ncbi:hypothetical protein CR513_37845, partial [Mucuna pruriens]
MYLVSGCLCHMMRERFVFQDLRPKLSRWVTFRGNKKGKIVKIGKIGKYPFPLLKMSVSPVSTYLSFRGIKVHVVLAGGRFMGERVVEADSTPPNPVLDASSGIHQNTSETWSQSVAMIGVDSVSTPISRSRPSSNLLDRAGSQGLAGLVGIRPWTILGCDKNLFSLR